MAMSSRASLKVAVLMGGPSAEREVSLSTGRGCAEALRGEGNAPLGEIMYSDGTIIISDRRDPENPQVFVRSNAEYLANFAKQPASINEVMDYNFILVSDGVGQVWGPYRFMVEGKTTHCGINAMTFIETKEYLWLLGNTTFTMVPPDECGNLDAPPAPEDSE